MTETQSAPDGETTEHHSYPAGEGFNITSYMTEIVMGHILTLNAHTNVPPLDIMSGLVSKLIERMAVGLVVGAPDDVKVFEAKEHFLKYLREQAERGFGEGMELRESVAAVKANMEDLVAKATASENGEFAVTPEMAAELRSKRAN